MKIPKQKTWHLNDKVYEVWVHVRVGGTFEDYAQYLQSYYKVPIEEIPTGNVNMGAYCGDIVAEEDGMILGYYLWFRHFDWSVDLQGTAVHEIFHLVNRILTRRGIFSDLEYDEPYAYYMSYWTRRLWRLFKIFT